jgi:hypothetical protein
LEYKAEELAGLLKSQRAGVNNVKSWWKLWYLLSDAKVEDIVAQFISNQLSASELVGQLAPDSLDSANTPRPSAPHNTNSFLIKDSAESRGSMVRQRSIRCG